MYGQEGITPSEEIKIKLKHRDWEVEIACPESKVKKAVEDVISGLDTSGQVDNAGLNEAVNSLRNELDIVKATISNFTGVSKPITSLPQGRISKGSATCRGLLEILWQEGYFTSERPLADVHDELSRRGYHYDRTAVSHSLADMVRESILARVGATRTFRYIQKRPIATVAEPDIDNP